MTAKITLSNASFVFDPVAWTVELLAGKVANIGTTTSGPLRLEFWLTPAPWQDGAANPGIKAATATMTLSGLEADYVFNNVDHKVVLAHPPAGNYFVTMTVAEYDSTAPGTTDGYVIKDTALLDAQFKVDAGGAISIDTTPLPTVSVKSQSLVEGDSGSSSMVFTLTLSKAAAFATSVQFNTDDETAFAGHDYTAVHQRVDFAPGATTATVTVPILNNTRYELTRAFDVALADAAGLHIADNYADPSGSVYKTAQPANAWGVIYDNDRPAGSTMPTDPSFALQWYLITTRVADAWALATGKGVRVALFDQGIDSSNPDLAPNVRTTLGVNSVDLQPGGAPVLSTDSHGTLVAGVIAAARNGSGLVGVAYDARLVSIYTSAAISEQYKTEIANAFRYAVDFDVLNDSWGYGSLLKSGTNWAFLDDAKSPDFAPAFAALRELAASGRHGLGTVVVQSAGNSFTVGDDTNLHNFQNSRYIITVGASDYYGLSSPFSTNGAAILVAAPGGDGAHNFTSVLTTDRSGSTGYNNGNQAFADGTSFSSPIVAGIVAMMLEANPTLGYRDVQQILAYSARQIDSANTTWAANGARDWNGGGLRFDAGHLSFGFGEVDALAAVRLAQAWSGVPKTVANTVDVIASASPAAAIPDNSLAGSSSTIRINADMTVERVDVTVNVTHPFIGDLEIILTSPTGTRSDLLSRPSQGTLSALGSSQHDVHFTFDTVLDMGEKAAGDWTLSVRDRAVASVGSFDSWTLDLIGQAGSGSHTFVYTSAYADLLKTDPGRGVLSDAGAVNDSINLGALGSANRLDLSGATASSLGGAALRIAAGTTVRNATGGAGDDTLIANAAGSVLRGMGGNDVLQGGAGTDTAVYAGARSQYTISKSDNGLRVADASGKEGIDQLTGIERLQFADGAMAYDIDGVGGHAYRLYQAAFNRAPDAEGLGYWMQAMDGGMSENAVAAGFMNSAEFVKLYGAAPSHQALVDQLYLNVLHRPGEVAGVAYWVGVLDKHDASPAAVLAAFAESAENQAALVGTIGAGFAYIPYS